MAGGLIKIWSEPGQNLAKFCPESDKLLIKPPASLHSGSDRRGPWFPLAIKRHGFGYMARG